jgi:AraC-like DNA-binding protein
MINGDLQFSLLELLSLLGLIQCVYIMVHLVGRAVMPRQIVIPVIFFGFLGFAFLLNAAESRWQDVILIYDDYNWFAWAIIPSLSALLIVQIIRITSVPPLAMWLLPFLYLPAYFMTYMIPQLMAYKGIYMNFSALVIGAFSLLAIWIYKKDLAGLNERKNGRERFWVIISLVFTNLGLLGLIFLKLTPETSYAYADLARTVLGLGFVYLGSTGLFRIYPHPVEIKRKSGEEQEDLSPDELKIAVKIENLLLRDKVYQEPGYNRASLARELEISEAQLSRIVSQYFEKTVPNLLNQYRVEDSKNLLSQTNAEIATITYEAGFNSVATFNRVFKEFVGKTPTQYRAEAK